MNKFITKIVGICLGLTMAVGVGVAVLSNKEAIPARATDSSIVFSSGSYANSKITWELSDVLTVVQEKNSGSTAVNKSYVSAPRWYSGHKVTFSPATGVTITQMSFTATSNGYATALTNSKWSTGSTSASGSSVTWTGNANSSFTVVLKDQSRLSTGISLVYSTSGGDPISYTGVTVSEKTPLTGTYKGDAYYECQASVSGTGAYSSSVTWSITNSNTYGIGTAIASKASIDTYGKITFLDNCNVYVWATAADGNTHNANGFSVIASGLLDNPISTWTKITNSNNVSTNGIYTLSNDGTNFGANAVANNQIALTASLSNIGYFTLEATVGGYYLRFATYNSINSVWEANGNYVNYNGDGTDVSSSSTASTVWTVVENGNSGVYLKISGGRHLGFGSNVIKAYANISSNSPVYLYSAGSLPVIECALIELTGKPSGDMSIGDKATLGYYAVDSNGNEWVGDVTYSISNESVSGVLELSATTGSSVTLTAKKAGTARVSVQDNAGNADPDYVDVTVLADPTRQDLPVGTYLVNIDYSNVAKNDPVPASVEYEIKAKEGTGANRVWYRNMSVAYDGVTATYAAEYTWTTNSTFVMTNNSNAIVTRLEISYYNGKRLAVTDANDNVISETNSSSNIVTYALNSESFTLTGTESGTSAYYIKITFSVVDENEEFLNLVVSKSDSWNQAENGTYNDGQTPTNSGLVATANYTTDGETISRSEDVTSVVSNWSYNPSTLSTGDTSFIVVATWDNHESTPFTVSGISVTAITGPITSGRYYIMTHDSTVGMNAASYTDKHPDGIDLSKSNKLTAFDVALVADNEYEISTTIEGTKYYLVNNSVAASSSNDNIKITNSPLGTLKSTTWVLESTEGGYYVKQNTTGSTYRYLSCYNSDHWRGYINKDYGDPVIKFVAEGSYADAIAEAIMSNEEGKTLCNNGVTAPSTTLWNNIANITKIENELAILRGVKATPKAQDGSASTGTTRENAMARYDEIMTTYNTQSSTIYIDFLGRIAAQNLVLKASANILELGEENGSASVVIVIVSLVSITAISGYFFVRKRREQ